MCDAPKTYKQAVETFKTLDENMRSRKKAFETAEAKLKAAKKLIEDAHPNAAKDEGYEVDAHDFLIVASKARKTETIDDPVVVHHTLEEEEVGLGDKLMTFSMTDLKKHLSPRQIESLTSSSYGARTFKVKAK